VNLLAPKPPANDPPDRDPELLALVDSLADVAAELYLKGRFPDGE
jgi:hypothetical protein